MLKLSTKRSVEIDGIVYALADVTVDWHRQNAALDAESPVAESDQNTTDPDVLDAMRQWVERKVLLSVPDFPPEKLQNVGVPVLLELNLHLTRAQYEVDGATQKNGATQGDPTS